MRLPLHPLRAFGACCALLVGTCTPWIAHAQAYGVRDLQLLVDRQDHAEALNHLRDIPPTARDAAWTDVASRAAVGQAGRLRSASGCRDAYDWLRAFRTDYGSLAAEPRIRAAQLDLGLCAVQDRGLQFRRAEHAALVEELAALDPDAIGAVYRLGGYADRDGRALAWIAAHPERARSDAQLKTVLVNAATSPPASDTPERRLQRFDTLRALGWYDAWRAAAVARLDTAAEAMARGRFGPATGETLANALRESGDRDDAPIARVLAPMAVRLSSARDPGRIAPLRTVSRAGLRQAESDLLRAVPDEGFWFEGPSWDEGTAFADVRALFPQLVRQAAAECAAFRRDPSKPPVHVWRSACEWMPAGG